MAVPKILKMGFSYDDVLLIPKRSFVKSRKLVDISTKITRNISLNAPIVSANMDTVTESEMAIAMARRGGIGIIHQFMTIEEQVSEVRHVKRSTSHIIEEPLTLQDSCSLGAALNLFRTEGISSALITDSEGKLSGIFTDRDYFCETDMSVCVSELMTKREHLITAPIGTSLDSARKMLKEHRIEKLPLVDDDFRIKGLVTVTDIEKTLRYPASVRDPKGRLLVGAAIGVKQGFLERAKALVDAGADLIVVDIAHGHSDLAINTVREVKSAFPGVDILAGNVATAEGAKDLIEAGADGIKVGVGPGAACITRLVAGAGVPQITAVMACAEEAKKYGVPVCADGGIKFPGDITKAIVAGADSVMLGSILAGTHQSPGQIIHKNGRRYKRYRGSASMDANIARREREHKERNPVLDGYTPEGVDTLKEYKGGVGPVIDELIGGLRSGISYCGSDSIKGAQENGEFIRMTSAGIKESRPHVLDDR